MCGVRDILLYYSTPILRCSTYGVDRHKKWELAQRQSMYVCTLLLLFGGNSTYIHTYIHNTYMLPRSIYSSS